MNCVQFPFRSGRPAVGVDLLLTDADGRPLPDQRGAEGHLKVKGPAVVRRYFGETAPATDEDGWFPTGDLARIDSQIAELQLAMAMETESLQLDRQTVTKGVSAVIADPNKGQYYVADSHGEIVGVMLTIPEWSDWRNATVIWIHSLYVTPDARRKGLFKKMYLDLKNRILQSDDLAGLRLFVDKDNAPARKTYEKLGMNKDHYQLYEWLK